jgi:hypothetical protein
LTYQLSMMRPMLFQSNLLFVVPLDFRYPFAFPTLGSVVS